MLNHGLLIRGYSPTSHNLIHFYGIPQLNNRLGFINPGLTLLVIWYNLQWMIPLKTITFMTSNIVKPVLTITSIISVGVRWGRYSSSRFMVKCFIFSVAFQLFWVKTTWPQKTPKECGAVMFVGFINTMKTIVIYSILKLYLPYTIVKHSWATYKPTERYLKGAPFCILFWPDRGPTMGRYRKKDGAWWWPWLERNSLPSLYIGSPIMDHDLILQYIGYRLVKSHIIINQQGFWTPLMWYLESSEKSLVPIGTFEFLLAFEHKTYKSI